MSLVKVPNKLIRKDSIVCEISNGVNVSPLFNVPNSDLNKLFLTCAKPVLSDYAMLINLFSNIGELKYVRDINDDNVYIWGFLHDESHLYVSDRNSHNRPVIFE